MNCLIGIPKKIGTKRIGIPKNRDEAHWHIDVGSLNRYNAKGWFYAKLSLKFISYNNKIQANFKKYSILPMNFLAHAMLSFNNPELQVGNMFGDFVKGNEIKRLPAPIQQGIILHRQIDQFTDKHPLVIESVALFKPHFRLSGGIFVDILFDHFLANDEQYFADDSLKEFTTGIYTNLNIYKSLMTLKMESYFGYMAKYDWLYNYKFEEGLRQSIEGLCKRYPKLGHGDAVMQHIEIHKQELALIYKEYFPQLILFVQDYLNVNSNLE